MEVVLAGHDVSKCHGSDPVLKEFEISEGGSGWMGSRSFPISRVGTGVVKAPSNLTVRVGSGHELIQYHALGQVGSRRGNKNLTGRDRS